MAHINNEADRQRAFACWTLFGIGSIALLLTCCVFTLVSVELESQIVVFLIIFGILAASLILGRWKAEPLQEEDFAERWMIGSWLITVLLLEIGWCLLIVCSCIWAIITHHRPPPGAI
jgi:uncharacterized membrane protein YidH (DUF202 family)